MVPFTVTPAFCTVNPTCDRITDNSDRVVTAITCDDFICDDDFNCKYTPDPEDYPSVPPGTYCIHIKGDIEGADLEQNSDATASTKVCFELIDLCNDARHTTIAPPQTFDQVYTLTDDSKPDYVFPDFEVFPDFCELEYDCQITQRLSNGETAVTLSGRTSSFFYDRTTDVLGDTQTVTCTVNSKSDFGSDAINSI